MKSYTDLEQSKKLAEILPIESADMCYSDVPVREWIDITDISKGTHVVFKSQIFAIENLHNHEIGEGDIYAWSLAALLDILDHGALFKTPQGWACQTYVESKAIISNYHSNPVDACYEMIINLHELKLL